MDKLYLGAWGHGYLLSVGRGDWISQSVRTDTPPHMENQTRPFPKPQGWERRPWRDKPELLTAPVVLNLKVGSEATAQTLISHQ